MELVAALENRCSTQHSCGTQIVYSFSSRGIDALPDSWTLEITLLWEVVMHSFNPWERQRQEDLWEFKASLVPGRPQS